MKHLESNRILTIIDIYRLLKLDVNESETLKEAHTYLTELLWNDVITLACYQEIQYIILNQNIALMYSNDKKEN